MKEYSRSIKHYREVSDLRIQYFCEYRFHLGQKLGEMPSEYAIEGERLHHAISTRNHSTRKISLFRWGLLLLSIMAILLWVFG